MSLEEIDKQPPGRGELGRLLEHAAEHLAPVTEHVADEGVKPVEVADGGPACGLEVEAVYHEPTDSFCLSLTDFVMARADLEGYGAAGLPAGTMGRTLHEDPLFFAAALAAGAVLGQALDEDDR